MGRKIITISVPPALHEFVEMRAKYGDYGSVSEYFRELIKLDQRRERNRIDEARRQNAMNYAYNNSRRF